MHRTKSISLPMKLFAVFGLISILSSSLFGGNVSTVRAQDPTPPAPNGEIQPLAESGSSLYYYVDGQRVNLTPSLDWVSVKFVSADASEQAAVTGKFSSTVTSLDGARQIPHLGLTLLPVKDGLGVKSVVQGVNSMRASSSSFSQVNPVYSYDGMDVVVSDEFVAAFPPATTAAEIDAINAARGVELVSEILGQENTFVLRVTPAASLDALAMANHYQESGLALSAAPNFVRLAAADPVPSTEKTGSIGPMFTPSDSYYVPDQWYLNNTQQYGGFMTADADIDAPEAWDFTTGDPSVVIAIIDEGVDFSHPELTGLSKMVAGYDATGLGLAGAPATNSDDAHGTAAAGIAAATSDNAQGIAGVCQDCKIMPVRIAYDNGSGWVYTDAWIANGITFAYQNGADVLNNSWGGGPAVTVVNTAITNAVTLGRGGKGSVVLAAAGNDNNSSVSWPASLDDVISVGALNMCDQRKNPLDGQCGGGENWGSNFGSALDVMAAGVWLTTTDIMGENGYTATGDAYGPDYFGYFNGTSGATPIVSGVVGLMLSINPYMTPESVQNALQKTADDLGTAGWDNITGYGRVNAFNAVKLAEKPDLVITSYEYRNATNTATIASPQSGEAFYIRMIVHNQGGTATGTFYPGVFLDDEANYGIDLNTADLGRYTDFQGYRISPSNSTASSEAGCVYYDPSHSINPLVDDFITERGNYTRSGFNDSIDAGGNVTTDVYIGYTDTEFPDAIYDPIRLGLTDGTHQIYLYADGNCSGGLEEGFEDNNSFGPISLSIGELPSGPTDINVKIGGASQGTYHMLPGTNQVLKYNVDGGPVEISSNNGVGFVASLNQWRRRPSTTVGWTGVAQSMALPVGLITNIYVIPRYDYSNVNALYNTLLIANVDAVPRDITITIGGVVKGVYTLGASQSQFVTYPGFAGGPVVVSSVAGAKIVASLYELIRDPLLPGWNGQSEMMGIPFSQLSDKYLLPMYFGAANPNTLNASLFVANVDAIPTTVEIKIAGVSQGTYLMQPNTNRILKYNVDGGPVEISSNNGAKIVASLNQWRRRPSTTVGWTGVAQSMALPVGLITNKYVIPRYDYSNVNALYNTLLIANVDAVSRDITITIGGVVKGVYTLGASKSQFVTYPSFAGGPVVVSSVAGAKIVASLYELIRDPLLPGWNGQSEMMGIPFSQLSDKYLLPMYFGAANPKTLSASLFIGVP